MSERASKSAPASSAEAPAPEILKELEELRVDARMGKDKHFAAANRTKSLNVLFGLPVVLVNLLLGSLFFTALLVAEVRNTVGPVLAFFAAALGAVHTFFNFHRSTEAHRAVGNRYIDVSRRCRTLIRGHQDGLIERGEVWDQLNELQETYSEINKEAEAFPTNSRDFRKAIEKKELRGEDKGEIVDTQFTSPS